MATRFVGQVGLVRQVRHAASYNTASYPAADSIVRVADLCIRRNEWVMRHYGGKFNPTGPTAAIYNTASYPAADSIVRVADLFVRRNAKMRQHDCMHYAAADSSVLIRTYPYKSVPASRAQQAFVLLHSTACRLLSAAFS